MQALTARHSKTSRTQLMQQWPKPPPFGDPKIHDLAAFKEDEATKGWNDQEREPRGEEDLE